MSLLPYSIVGGLVLSVVSSYFAMQHGKKVERAEWQEASIEVLVENNINLSDEIDRKAKEIADNLKTDVDAGNEAQDEETKTITKIVRVPVETVIKINSKCKLDYGIVELRNGWTTGSSDEGEGNAPRSILPDDFFKTLPGNTGIYEDKRN